MHIRQPAAAMVGLALLAVSSTNVIAQTVWQKHLDPVLVGGTSGSWDESTAIANTVLFQAGTYKMWYGGNGGFGYATSSDGLTWTKHPANPILVAGPPGSWDEVDPYHASVVFANNTYHMWYSAVGSQGRNRVGHATSPDGIAWTKDPANPVLDLGPDGSWDDQEVIHPRVMFKDNTFHMWYNGVNATGQRILYAQSSDGTVWNRFPYPALEPGPQGSWDDGELGPVDVIYDGYAFRMFYTAWNQATEFRIGYAVSPDGRSWWKDSTNNPVLSPGTAGSWDDTLVGLPVVRLEGTQYKMWYGGSDGVLYETGYATSDVVTTDIGRGANRPLTFELDQNYPNPFNPRTTIRYDLREVSRVSLKIYDVSGRLVRALLEGDMQSPGSRAIQWDGRDSSGRRVASGVYFYRLEAGTFSLTRQMTLVK